jgi:AGCS family alanine or glycine:cation symporter
MKNTVVWLLTGGLIPLLLILLGGFFFLYLRGRPLLSPRRMLRTLAVPPKESGISPFRAVTLALAGTLGVGNIVGVANAIYIGGAGALFWMWISAIFAMLLKYAEILLAVRHRRTARDGSYFGGAVYYIRDCLWEKRRFRLASGLCGIFAILIVLDALGMGCVIQVNAISSAFEGVTGLPSAVTGFSLLLLAMPVILRGTKGVSALTEYLVPIMTGGYIILSVSVCLIRREALGDALASVFRDAFAPKSAVGGLIGFLTSRALRVGTMRGLLSNEAGCGTAPTAHACARTDSPAAQGIWGIFEVFVDTILLCTATALVILVSYPQVEALGENAVMMTIRAYSCVLGGWSEYFFCAAILCFGFATVICWASYGLENLSAVTSKKRWRALYLILFAVCIPLGAVFAPSLAWTVSDFAISSLTVINLIILFLCRQEIREETERWYQSPFFSKKPKKP